MAESIFEKSLKAREMDQEQKKVGIGLQEAPVRSEKIYLSLPADCKELFVNYCKENHTTASAQLRAWIYEFCEK